MKITRVKSDARVSNRFPAPWDRSPSENKTTLTHSAMQHGLRNGGRPSTLTLPSKRARASYLVILLQRRVVALQFDSLDWQISTPQSPGVNVNRNSLQNKHLPFELANRFRRGVGATYYNHA